MKILVTNKNSSSRFKTFEVNTIDNYGIVTKQGKPFGFANICIVDIDKEIAICKDLLNNAVVFGKPLPHIRNCVVNLKNLAFHYAITEKNIKSITFDYSEYNTKIAFGSDKIKYNKAARFLENSGIGIEIPKHPNNHYKYGLNFDINDIPTEYIIKVLNGAGIEYTLV